MDRHFLGFYSATDEDEAVEEEEDYESEFTCAGCEDPIQYTDEIFIVELADALKEDDGSVFIHPITEPNGDYSYEPFFLHIECWEAMRGEIEDSIENSEVLRGEHPVIRCEICQTFIDALEPFCSNIFGEIQCSPRQPEGVATGKMARMGRCKPICLACLSHVVMDYFPQWEDMFNDLIDQEVEEEEQDDEY